MLLVLLVAIGAAAFCLPYLHRTPLPATTPQARAIPSIASAPGPFRLLDRNRKNVQPLFNRYDCGQHPGQAFYVADSVDDERGFENRVGKPLLLRDSDDDPALADRIVSRVGQLLEMLAALAILPAHGRSACKKLFSPGPLTCGHQEPFNSKDSSQPRQDENAAEPGRTARAWQLLFGSATARWRFS